MTRYARLCVSIAALGLGVTTALALARHPSAALFIGLLTAAAALTALRELVSRETRP